MPEAKAPSRRPHRSVLRLGAYGALHAVVLPVAVLLAVACGGSGSPSEPAPPACADLSGNWQATWSQVESGCPASGGGPVTVSQNGCRFELTLNGLASVAGDLDRGMQLSATYLAGSSGAGPGCGNPTGGSVSAAQASDFRLQFGAAADGGPPCCQHVLARLER